LDAAIGWHGPGSPALQQMQQCSRLHAALLHAHTSLCAQKRHAAAGALGCGGLNFGVRKMALRRSQPAGLWLLSRQWRCVGVLHLRNLGRRRQVRLAVRWETVFATYSRGSVRTGQPPHMLQRLHRLGSALAAHAGTPARPCAARIRLAPRLQLSLHRIAIVKMVRTFVVGTTRVQPLAARCS
jgi:hypothetical protein